MEITIKVNDDITSFTMDDNQNILDEYLQNEHKEDYIKQLIHNGYMMSLCILPTMKSCGCCSTMNSLREDLTELFEPFQNVGNSSRNGRFGEIFASSLFTKRNPHIEYTDTASIEKSGDAIINLNNHDIKQIMIDYKYYDSPIPSTEVDKLVRDLHAQNIDYGILLSYKSKISKRKNIDYDIIDGKLIVFVAAYGLDIFVLEMAIEYIKKLYECNSLSMSQKITELVNKQTMNTISELYETIYELSRDLSQNINKIKENQDKINKMFYSMIHDGQKILTKMNILLEKVDTNIKEISFTESTHTNTFTELVEYVNMIVDKEKDKTLCLQLFNMTHELSIKSNYENNYIYFFDSNDNHQLGKLQLHKSKVTMIFYNTNTSDECSFNMKYEEIKQGNFHIILSDNSEKWKIIKRRFTAK